MKNNYDAAVIYNQLQIDIQKQKWMILFSAFAFLILLTIIIPMVFWIFFGLLGRADLPFLDHNLLDIFRDTKLFLFPYAVLLIFYFTVMYLKDKEQHLSNEIHFDKAIQYFTISLVIMILPYVFAGHIFLTIIYFVFFILTVYHLSLTYYDVELQQVYNIHSKPYRSEDLGWMSSMGILDNPFSISDDMNRAKVFVQTSTLGFDFIVLFINMIVKSIIFTYAIRYKQYIQESARLFDIILENKLDGEYATFSVQSKIILESLSYLSFRDGKIVFYERGQEVERIAEVKDQE